MNSQKKKSNSEKLELSEKQKNEIANATVSKFFQYLGIATILGFILAIIENT